MATIETIDISEQQVLPVGADAVVPAWKVSAGM